MPQLRFFKISVAKEAIQTGDLLLCRRGARLADRLLSVAGRSPYVHAGMAVWIADSLYIADVLQFVGGRLRLLSEEVAQYPDRYDVFNVDKARFPEFDREGAAERMLAYGDSRYGWRNVTCVGLRHLAFIRLLFPPLVDDRANGTHPPFCSEAYSNACRLGGGVDPVPNLAGQVTEPGDLARSLLFRYQLSLTV